MNLMIKATDSLCKLKTTTQQHSPELYLAAGIVTSVGAIVLACRATMKVKPILEEHHEAMAEIRKDVPDKKEVAIQYAKTAGKIGITYGPAFALELMSLGCFVKNYKEMKKINTGLAAACITATKGFQEYRNRVIEKYGEEEDRKLYYNLHEEEVEETIVDEKGKEKTVKKKVTVADGKPSMYTRYLTKANPNYEESDDFMQNFISMQCAYLTNELRRKELLVWNESLEATGMPCCNDGMVVGWKYDKHRPTAQNQVVIDCTPVMIKNEFNQLEKAYLLNYHVDGLIYNEDD